VGGWEVNVSSPSREKWDLRFLQLAALVASWSKDPSTQVGSVITDGHNRIYSVGFNGLPVGVKDTAERLENRELKYRMIIHAERNAILFAHRSLVGATIYIHPLAPCPSCASMVIQAGIRRVVSRQLSPELQERWHDDLVISAQMFQEAHVELYHYPHD
jgi:dCMP deaminase